MLREAQKPTLQKYIHVRTGSTMPRRTGMDKEICGVDLGEDSSRSDFPSPLLSL